MVIGVKYSCQTLSVANKFPLRILMFFSLKVTHSKQNRVNKSVWRHFHFRLKCLYLYYLCYTHALLPIFFFNKCRNRRLIKLNMHKSTCCTTVIYCVYMKNKIGYTTILIMCIHSFMFLTSIFECKVIE